MARHSSGLNILAKTLSVVVAAAFFFCAIMYFSACGGNPKIQHEGYLKDIYADYFTVGAALNSQDFKAYDDLLGHYNSVTAMYEMKWGHLEPAEGQKYYRQADSFIESASQAGMGVRGHTLVWYRNVPEWFFIIKEPDKEQALSIMSEYIADTIAHFKDAPIYAWDVVNEALHNSITQERLDSGNLYRNAEDDASHFDREEVFDWYGVCGKDYIEQAFIAADEACRENGLEDVRLFYNDYLLNLPLKRQACVIMVKGLLDKGVRIDGIGEQAHYSLNSYLQDKDGWLNNFELMIQKFTELGVDVQLTELEITVNGGENGQLTEQQEKDQAEMYGEIFRICRKYSNKYEPWKEGAGKVTGITFWGIADTTDSFSRIFNADQTPKAAVEAIMTFAEGEGISDTPDTKNVAKAEDVNAPTATGTWQYWTQGTDDKYDIVQNSYEDGVLTFRAKSVGDDLALIYLPVLEDGSNCTVRFTVQTNKACGSIEGSQILQIAGIGTNGGDSEWITLRANSAAELTYELSYDVFMGGDRTVTMKDALTSRGFYVNETLWNVYENGAAKDYKMTHPTWQCVPWQQWMVHEAPWEIIEDAAGSTFASYGDVAIITLSRLGGEYSDLHYNYKNKEDFVGDNTRGLWRTRLQTADISDCLTRRTSCSRRSPRLGRITP